MSGLSVYSHNGIQVGLDLKEARPHALIDPTRMNIPVMVQEIRRCWPGSTFRADRGSNRAPNNMPAVFSIA
jgi:hypothetical protein